MDWIRIPFCKALSPGELKYLTEILLGFDRQLGVIAEYIGSEEYAELQFMNQMQIDAFFRNSGIEERLDELIKFNASTSEEFIREFYRLGAEQGYDDIEQTLAYTLADEKALFFVSQYNFELIKNVNQELKDGIKKVILESVAAGEGYQTTMSKLMQLPLEPINHNISVRTRAEMIARTEEARAHNTGTLQAYANYGVDMVEVITSHDKLVCDYCRDLEAKNPYPIQQAKNLIPAHPCCRCYYTAYLPEPDSLESFGLVDNPLIINLCPSAV